MADEEQNQDSEIIDLNMDVTEADVARPVMKSGTYDMRIAYVRGTKSKADAPMLLVGYKLDQDGVTDTQNRPVNKGFMVSQNYLMNPTGGLTKEMIDRKFQQIHFAAAGAGRVNTGAWVNKPVRCQVKVREPKDGYGESNEINGVLPRKAA